MKSIRLFLVLACAMLLSLPAKAERVNMEKAEKIARSYARTTPRLKARKDFRLSRTVSKPLQRSRPGLQSAVQSAAQQEEPLYYVFTMNGDGGFIIVAGDDVAKPVLGYSDEGTYDESNPNLAYWMETLAQEIAGAIENGISQDAQTKAAWNAFDNDTRISPMASGDYVDPLVKTKWNQSAPYNNLCPKVSGAPTYTGCVATAMAQIMKYHGHPTTRTVTIPDYTTKTEKITIPAISGATYGWNIMTNTYTSSASGAPADAVATLMYHCGASVEMDYDTDASGAYSSNVAKALKAYFDYDAGIAFHHRDYYTYTAWITLLKTEIGANRPVYYAGYGKSGHAFVCDGYDADGLFHFNWGWGGSSDGYFEVSALNPGSLGIGGGSGGYNEGQEIITGIQPNQGGSGGQPAIQLGLSTFSANKSSLSSVTESFSVSAGDLTNTGVTTIASVYLGVMLYNQDGSLRTYKTTSSDMSLPPGQYFPSYPLATNYSLPSGLPAGTYTLYPAYSTSSGTPSIIPGKNGNRYITVVVQNGKVTLTGGVAAKPDLSLISLKTVENLYQNKPGSFEAEITNSGTADYNSRMSIRLSNQTVATEPVVIPAGTTKTVGFSGTITLTPGNYSLLLRYDPNNIPESTPSTRLGDAVTNIEVKAVPAGQFNLSLVSASFKNGSSTVPKNEPNLTVKIKNEEGLYADKIRVFVFPDGGGTSVGYFDDFVLIEKGETKTILFNSPMEFVEAGAQYYLRVYYYSATGTQTPLGDRFYFTVAPLPPPSSDATLKSLVVKDAQTQALLTLTPAFSSTATRYTVNVDNATTRISMTGEANHVRAKFANIENQPLNDGRQAFQIKVTAEDGTSGMTYTVTVVQGDPPTPGNSGMIAVADTTTYSLTLNWTKATDNATPGANLKYYVYQSRSDNINTSADCKNNGTLLNPNGTADIATWPVSGLTANTTYYFNVVVEDEEGSRVAYTAAPATTKRGVLRSFTTDVGTLTPPFDPDITDYTVTLPCGVNNLTVNATSDIGNTVDYRVAAAPAAFPLLLNAPGSTTLVVRVTAQDGITTQDYNLAVIRPFDVSIIRRYWNDVLAVNLNPNTNGGYTFTAFQWTQNGQPLASQTGPYLYFPPVSLPVSGHYGVWLTTTDGQVMPTCSELQITPAAKQAPPGLLAYPNPARYAVTFENPQWETARQTDLIALNGNIVRSYSSARIQTLDVSGLPAGLYILRSGAYSVKIIIE
jgi:hypothetical protein